MGMCCSRRSHQTHTTNNTFTNNLKSFKKEIEKRNSLSEEVEYEVHIIDHLDKEIEKYKMHLDDIGSYSRISKRATLIKRIPSDIKQHLEDIIVFWYDDNENDFSSSNKLKEVVTECHSCVYFFTNQTACIDSIQAVKEEKIVVITVNTCKISIILDIHYRVSVQSIIMLEDENEQSNNTSSSNELFSKLVKIQKKSDILKREISTRLHAIRQRISRFHFYDHRQTITKDLTAEAASYLWFQLMLDVLKRMTSQEQAKDDMLKRCRDYYSSDLITLESIRKFEETYDSRKAIEWYAKPSFIYKIVNKALRTEDPEQLYTFRFFIVDLSEQIAEEHQKICEDMPDIFTVYRGLHLTLKECKNLEDSIGKYISINGYLSTSRNEDVAKRYAEVSTFGANEMQSVIFKIKVKKSKDCIKFAYIGGRSPIPADEEVLFDIGTTCAIDNVAYIERDRNWEVNLTTIECGSILKNDYIKINQHEMIEGNIIFLFGKLLIDMGEFSKACEYFTRLASDNQYKTQNLLPSIYYYIGLSLFHAGDCRQAFLHYLSAFQQQKKLIDERKEGSDNLVLINFARILNGIGVIYSYERRFKESLGCYFAAWNILKSHLEESHPLIAACLANIGITRREQGFWDSALTYHNRCLTILEAFYKFEHPDCVRALINKALVLDDKGEHESALAQLKECRNSIKGKLPKDHPLVAIIHLNIGIIYINMNNAQLARSELFKALGIFERVLPPLHPDIAITLANIGTTYEKQKNELGSALHYYRRALDIRQRSLPRNHIHLAESYLKIGNVYHLDEQWSLAHQFCSNALTIYNQLKNTEKILASIEACSNILELAKRNISSELALIFIEEM